MDVRPPDPHAWLTTLDRRAQLRGRAGLARSLRPRPAHDGAVDLAGNDYLGLARHPDVLAAAHAALDGYGLGATGSRIIRGSTDAHAALEDALADWLGADFALGYSSGYLANLGAIRALTGPRTLLVNDSHNHASIHDGCRLAGAETVTVDHADPAAVDAALAAHPGRPAVVITESIFSVAGDLAPLARLHEVTRARGAVLLVDEAHALGVIGPGGAGGAAAAGLGGAPDVVLTGTLSKALGGAGGVIAGPTALRQHLLDTGRTFVYDTAPPPAVAAGVHAALVRTVAGDDLRAELRRRAALAVGVLRAAGFTVAEPAGGVVAVHAPGPDEAIAWALTCLDKGVAVGAFRPPSTPDHASRLRLTINVGVPAEAFRAALDTIVAAAP